MVRIYTFSLPDDHYLIGRLERTKNRSKLIRRMMKNAELMTAYKLAGEEICEVMNQQRKLASKPPVPYLAFVSKWMLQLQLEEEE